MLKQSRSRIIISLLIVSLLSLAIPSFTVSATLPPLKTRVNDYAAMLSQDTVSSLEQQLAALEQSDSTQIVVLTIPSLEGDSLEEYSIRVAEQWKIGQQQFDNGALLLISKGDRKIRIEVGYGLEGSLTDLMAGRIIDQIITPAFKKGNFDKGVRQGVDAMVKAVMGEFSQADFKKSRKSSSNDFGGIFIGFLFFCIAILRPLAAKHPILSALVGAVVFPLVGLLMGAGIFLLIVLFILGGIIGYIMTNFPETSGGHSGGSWNSGYSSGSSGGFGGFSGGGGGFGGGGASGGW